MGLTWVLSRLSIELLRPIIGTERVTVITWPVTRDVFFQFVIFC
jgi:acyl-ACP thioesterase